MKKGKLLWVGDAVCETGFSRVTHHVLPTLAEEWDLTVLGINYWGDPHDFPPEWNIWPVRHGDPFGFRRLGRLATKTKPDVIFLLTDPWHIPRYLQEAGNCPSIASLAVDGKNCRGRGLNGLASAIFWTEFGKEEAALGGYQGKADVVPLGVDLDVYKPRDRVHARKALGLPPGLHEDGFIVGNVNRNQPRKWLDLTVAYFAEWVRTHKIPDAYLYLHIAPTADQGWEIAQLCQYYGITNRLIYADPTSVASGVDEIHLAHTYAAFDVQVSTTQGEGFGLTTLEGMACGVPQIVPAWSALKEICDQGALQVPCTTIVHTPNNINAVGGLPDREEWIGCLDRLYRSPRERERLSSEAVELAQRRCYRWRSVGERIGRIVDETLSQNAQLAASHGESKVEGL